MVLKRTYTLVAALTVAVLAITAGVPTAHAAGVPLTASGAIISSAAYITSLLITIMNTFTWILFMLLDKVLNPEWIFDLQNPNGLTNMLREIWQLCRDLVNLGLALTLIAGAIMMIVTADASKVKAALPKFVMALILVNFSWFIPRAIFDASQILTYTVYQIPSLLGADGCILPPTETQPARPCEIVTNYAFFRQTDFIDNAGNLNVPGAGVVSTGWSCILRPLVCIQTAPIGSPQATVNQQMHSNVLNGLIVNHARLRTLVRISDPRPGGIGPAPGGGLDQIGATLTFLVKMVIVLLIHAALFFPLLAMVAAFFIRIPVLWVTMAFMPLTALSYVLGDGVLGDMSPKKLFQEQFIQAVFLPTKVAIPFTIGFIMVNAGSQTAAPGIFAGALPIAVFSGISSLWQMMWMIIAVYIVWKYSFETLEKGPEQARGVVGAIKGYGSSAFELAKQGALNVPFLPVANTQQGGRASLADLGRSLNPRTGLNQLASGQPLQLWTDNIRQAVDQRERARGERVSPGSVQATTVVNNTPALQNNVRTEVTILSNPGTAPADRDLATDRIVQQLRASGQLTGVSETDGVQGALRALNVDPALRQQIIARLRARGGATRNL